MSSRLSAVLLLALIGALAPAARAQPGSPIFADGFESANTLAWALSVGEPALVTPDVFRFADLDLRDPHVFVNVPIFGCSDFTDNPLPLGLGPSFNQQIATALTTDGDADTFLDLSPLLQFRPYSASAAGLRLDVARGLCTAPVAGTSCVLDPAVLPQTTLYDGLTAGTCLTAISGTTSSYTPSVPSATAPCFVTQPRPMTLELQGIALPLLAVRVAGEPDADPPLGFSSGLLMGFLTESAAATVLLPADVPIVGDQPITVLLPGGAGSCAAGDDRDILLGQSGWWFYFEFSAAEVPFSGS